MSHTFEDRIRDREAALARKQAKVREIEREIAELRRRSEETIDTQIQKAVDQVQELVKKKAYATGKNVVLVPSKGDYAAFAQGLSQVGCEGVEVVEVRLS
jgi:hypothetical protein